MQSKNVATCINHPGVPTETACQRCRYPYCGDCLVELAGQRLCAPCRDQVVLDLQRVAARGDQGARDALIWACVGFLCNILAPFALARGIQALRRLEPD